MCAIFAVLPNRALRTRNLTRDQLTIILGRRYLAEKKAPHRPKGAQNGHLPEKTAIAIATDYGVSKNTVRRAAKTKTPAALVGGVHSGSRYSARIVDFGNASVFHDSPVTRP